MRSVTDSPTNPTLVEEIGEDPAQFLDRPVSHADQWPKARIDGIERLAVCRAWMAVERKLGRGDGGGPRDLVMQWLEAREAFLQEAGDLEERMEPRDYDRDLPEATVTINGVAAEEARSSTAIAKLQSRRVGDAVATDGGVHDGE